MNIHLPREVKFWNEDFGKNEIADLYQLVRNILTTFADVMLFMFIQLVWKIVKREKNVLC